MIELLYKLIACHFIGDYVFQIDLFAKTKGDNFWHMLAHCFMYSVPFAVVFGFGRQLGVVIVAHFVVDSLKARWHKIGYMTDQILHIATLTIYII